jgi:hypothetical protein
MTPSANVPTTGDADAFDIQSIIVIIIIIIIIVISTSAFAGGRCR